MDEPPASVRRAARVTGASMAALFGLGLILLAVTVGDCAAFGDRCPAERPSPLEDDVFGTAALGAFVATAVPLALLGPPGRRSVRAVGVGVTAAIVVGLIARVSANG